MVLRIMLVADDGHQAKLERLLHEVAGDAIEIVGRCSDTNKARIQCALLAPDMVCVGPGINADTFIDRARRDAAGLPFVFLTGGSAGISGEYDIGKGMILKDLEPTADEIVAQLETCALIVAHNRGMSGGMLRHPPTTYQSDLIALPHQKGIDVRSIMSIVHIKGEGNYTVIHFDKGSSVVMSRTMADYGLVLPPAMFIRIHRSHIVNIYHVRRILRGKVMRLLLSNDQQVEVSDGKRDTILGLVNMLRRR